MAKSIIIVESPNDASFIQLLLPAEIEVDSINQIRKNTEFEYLHNFTDLEGRKHRGKDALGSKLKMLQAEILKFHPDLQELCVILDIDNEQSPNGGFNRSIAFVNKCFEGAFGSNPDLKKEGEKKKIEAIIVGEIVPILVSCFFIKDETGQGNMDTLMKTIATGNSYESECFEQMNACVMKKNSKGIQKYERQWLGYYLRSKATKPQLNDAEKRLHEVIYEYGKEIFNLDHILVKDLRVFLSSFV